MELLSLILPLGAVHWDLMSPGPSLPARGEKAGFMIQPGSDVSNDQKTRSVCSLALYAPDTVEDVSIGEDPDVEVGGEDVVELPNFLVPEEGVGHPDFASVGEGEVADPL